MSKDQIWSFKYEPTKLADMILHPDIRPKLEKTLTEKPNLLLYGSAGVGKGTFTKIFLNETGSDYMWVNASDKTGIDYIRNEVRIFAYAPDINIKIVVFNEADALSSGQSGAQKILRQLMEDTHKQTRFFFLANYDQYIIPEIKSRCEVINIDRPPKKEIGNFALKILKSEKIEYDKKSFLSIVEKCYPDIRKTIWSLQENSINGKLISTHTFSSEDIFKQILDNMLQKDPDLTRKVLKNNYINYIQLYEYIYENAGIFKSPGDAVIKIGEAQKWDSIVANKEINFMAMFIDLLKLDAI
jgi:DNA polymerase III delta prime subunit